MNYQYIRTHYNVPAETGRIVSVNGRPGIIIEDLGHYLGVNFFTDKPGQASPCHPTWRVEYKGMGQPRPTTKSQQRYKRYLEYGDSFDSFIDFCRWDTHPTRQWNHQAT